MSLLQPLDEIQQTLAEYERLAISTEQWNGTEPPEFSDDGEKWSAAWRPSEPGQFPSFCRATVYRRDVDHPTIVVVRWDEALPTDDQWRQLEIAIRRRLYDVQDEAPDPVPAPEEDEPQIPVRRQPQDHKPSTRKQQRRRKGRR